MKRTTTKRPRTDSARTNPFQLRNPEDAFREVESQFHVFGHGAICDTDTRGHATAGDRTPTEIVVDASEGFIPLWGKDMILRWRFQERSMSIVEDPESAKIAIKELLGQSRPNQTLHLTRPASAFLGLHGSLMGAAGWR